MAKQLTSERFRNLIYSLWVTLDPRQKPADGKGLVPPTASENERLKKCQMIVEDHVDPQNEETTDTLWLDIKVLQQDQAEASVMTACCLVSRLIDSPKPPMGAIEEFLKFLFSCSFSLTQSFYIDFASELFHDIAHRFSESLSATLKENTANLIRSLFPSNEAPRPQTASPAFRYLAYSFLNQIFKLKPHLVWKELKRTDAKRVFETIIGEHSRVFFGATHFLVELMKCIGRLLKEEQKHYFSGFVNTLLLPSKDKKDDQFLRLFHFTYKWVFESLHPAFFPRDQLAQIFETAVENIRVSFERSDPETLRLMFDMIPHMVKYSPVIFAEKKLGPLLGILIQKIASIALPVADPFRLIFGVLTNILTEFSTDQLGKKCEEFAKEILQILLDYWQNDPRTNSDISNVLGCFFASLKHTKNLGFLPEDSLHHFVSSILIFHFNETSLKILEHLKTIVSNELWIQFEEKLWVTILVVLKSDSKDFEDNILKHRSKSVRFSAEEDKYDMETKSIDLTRMAPSSHSFKDDHPARDLETLSLVNLDLKKEAKISRAPRGTTDLPTDVAPRRKLDRLINIWAFKERLRKRLDFVNRSPKPATAARPVVSRERQILVALDALSRFNASFQNNPERRQLIKDAVLSNLEVESSNLRRQTGRIVFLLISDRTQTEPEGGSGTSLQGILKKIMEIAIGDPDDLMRIEILSSLNAHMKPQFIPHILTEDNLKRLVMMAVDSNNRVQEQVVLLFHKLIPACPKLLARFDQLIFVSSSYLVTSRDQYSKNSLNKIRLLGFIAKHSQMLLGDKLPVLCSSLVGILADVTKALAADLDNPFFKELVIAVLDCLGHLLNYQPDLSREHFRACLRILVSNFERFKEKVLSESMLFLILLARNSGLQLVMVIEFNIILVLMKILDGGVGLELRLCVLRLLGTIGAIGPAKLRRISHMVEKHRSRGLTAAQTYPKVMEKIRKSPFNFEGRLALGSSVQSHPAYLEFDAFLNEAYLVQKDPQAVVERLLIKTEAEADKAASDHPAPQDSKKHLRLKLDESGEPANDYNEKIQNEEYLLGYVTHHTLTVLFDPLRHQQDEQLTLKCLESIQQIILALGKHIFGFRRIVFGPLLEAFRQAKSERVQMLVVQDIKYFVKASSAELAKDAECVAQLSRLLLEYLNDLRFQTDLLTICKLLVRNKGLLQHRFKDVVVELLKMLGQNPSKKTVVETIFDILITLDNTDHYFLITPALLELFPVRPSEAKGSKSPDFLIVRHTLRYLGTILNTRHFEFYFGNILRALCGLVEGHPQIAGEIETFMLQVFQRSGERCFDYLQLIHPHLSNNAEYQRTLRSLDEKGYFEVQPPDPLPNLGEAERSEALCFESSPSLKEHSLRPGSFSAIKDCFLINNFNKSDFSWDDWFADLKRDLFSSSHSTVLVACKNLLSEKKIIDRLFKPAFVLFWSQLNEHKKSQITRGFDLIISNTDKIPGNICKKILELVEFMSHPNEFGMVLNISKLADFAINCNSASQALFFKEMEFQTNPLNAIEALLDLYLRVGYRDAAEGLLDHVQNNLGMKVEEKWLQLLGKWDLMIENSTVETQDTSSLQVFSSIATSNWEVAHHKIEEILKTASSKPLDAKIYNYQARAALQLGKWTEIKKAAKKTTEEPHFYKAIALLKNGKEDLGRALNGVAEELKTMEKSLQSLSNSASDPVSNYASNYEKLVKLQKYVEMEEAITREQHFRGLEENALYGFLLDKKAQEERRQASKRHMLAVWEDKLFSMERSIDFWQEILATRNVFIAKEHMLNSYLKFSGLCYFTDNAQLFTRILTALKKEIAVSDAKNHPVELAELECNFKTGKLQLRPAVQKIEELVVRPTMPKEQMPLFYKKMGPWIINADVKAEGRDDKMIKFFERFLNDPKAKEDPRLWHYYAIANYQMIKDLDRPKAEQNIRFVLKAMIGFANSVVYETKLNGKNTLQDLLKFLQLWYNFHDFSDTKTDKVGDTIEKCIRDIPKRNWLLVVRQVIARLENNPSFSGTVKNLLISLFSEFPQYLVFQLLLAKKSKDPAKARMMARILGGADPKHKTLISEATLFSDQLIRISLFLDELWLQSKPETKKFKDLIKPDLNKRDLVIGVLNNLFDLTSARKGRSSLDEIAFFQKFGCETKQVREFLDLYESCTEPSKKEFFFLQAWNMYQHIVWELDSLKKEGQERINLERVSPELFNMKNLSVCVPGTLERNVLKQSDIRIVQVKTELIVLSSKRRPRKLSLFGSNAKEYSFLLKGKEDLRLDERVMQLFTVINDLLKPTISESNHALKITTYNVLPLSFDCGIISWLEGCQTLYDTIEEYRQKIGLSMKKENEICQKFHRNYDAMSKVKKLEVYNYVMANTKGVDLKNIFWLRSSSADQWLLNRGNFICSVAVMSMVGCILGLGDRHPKNIMLERSTGKVVHIDFGECFESEQRRESLPEKVPFRLTRNMVNAMEACGTEGTFKSSCEAVMNILRLNKDVVLSFFEEFVVDPLKTWKSTDKKDPVEEEWDIEGEGKSVLAEESKNCDHSFIVERPIQAADNFARRNETFQGFDDHINKSRKEEAALNALPNDKMLNPLAKAALNTIINKLSGKDFDNVENDYKSQVKKLIKQATNPENLSQAYSGWCPFL